MSFDPKTLTPATIAAIKADAVAKYPNESCGAITSTGYMPLENVSATPRIAFDCNAQLVPLQAAGTLLALVHSHPDGPEGPSKMDMQQQAAMAVPWGIVICNAEMCSNPYWWSDTFEPPPLERRQFRHGPSGTDGRGDCYALVRDYYRTKKNTQLIECPRDDGWWNAQDNPDLYNTNFTRAGFARADENKPEVGDVVLMRIRSTVTNHAAIYIGAGMILHHLPNRYSRPEPMVGWIKLRTAWLRHAG
jgi:proteasome lid subunit RPN8/RPN11